MAAGLRSVADQCPPTGQGDDRPAPPVLSTVFDFLVASKPSSAASAALICHRWRDSAQRALFANVALTGESGHARLKSEARPRYRTLGINWLRDADYENVPFSTVKDVLSTAVGVRRLTVGLAVAAEGGRVLASPSLAGQFASLPRFY